MAGMTPEYLRISSKLQQSLSVNQQGEKGERQVNIKISSQEKQTGQNTEIH